MGVRSAAAPCGAPAGQPTAHYTARRERLARGAAGCYGSWNVAGSID